MKTEPIDFIVAGVQKGGTTSLDAYLRALPGICMAKTKELHFFDDDTLDWDQPDYSTFHDNFEAAEGRLRGEATPIYFYWPKSLKRIYKYNPDMKIILLFRDPVERAWSHWRMELGRQLETADFSWAIRDGRSRLMEQGPHPGFHPVYSYVERGFYGEQLARALNVFPREQLLLLRSDALMRDPTTTLSSVVKFLGAPNLPGAMPQLRANVGSTIAGQDKISEADAAYLAQLYSDDRHKFSALSLLDVSDWRT